MTKSKVQRTIVSGLEGPNRYIRFGPSLISAMDSPNSLGCCPSCPNGISDTLRPLPSEWTYPNVAGKPIPCFRDAVMLKSACPYAFVGISGRSYRPRVFIGFSSLRLRVDAGSNPAGGTHEKEWPGIASGPFLICRFACVACRRRRLGRDVARSTGRWFRGASRVCGRCARPAPAGRRLLRSRRRVFRRPV